MVEEGPNDILNVAELRAASRRAGLSRVDFLHLAGLPLREQVATSSQYSILVGVEGGTFVSCRVSNPTFCQCT